MQKNWAWHYSEGGHVPLTETGRISVMKGSRRVLVKVVLFQLRGRSQPQNDATANFFANSERPILGLSNEVSFVPEILW